MIGVAMSYATVTDVQVRLGRPIIDTDEIEQVNAWLSDVEALILSRIPDLVARIDEGTIAEAVLVMVEARAVVRKAKNPDGKQNERIDDYSYGLNADAARGEVFLTDEEWGLLLPVGSATAFTVRPFGQPDYRSPSGWFQ